MSSAIQQLAAKLNRLEREVRATATTPYLAYSSIEDGGSIGANAADGTTMAQFGGQFDGSFGAMSLNGPTPPTPSAPTITPAVGGLTVLWDGLFTDAEFAPMDFGRVEIHVSTDPAFVPDVAASLVSTIESPRGGHPFIATANGVYYVALVVRSLSGARGPASATAGPVTVDNTMVLNGSQTVNGEFTTLDTDGSVLLKSGTQDHGDRGLSVYRDDGTPAIVIKRTFTPTDPRQSMILYDSIGHSIGGDAILSPTGFDAPHVPIPFTPSNVTNNNHAQATSSATFAALFEHDGYRQNAGLQLKVKAWCSNGTTTADIQVWDVIHSAYLCAPFTTTPVVISVPTATTAPTVFEGGSMLLPGLMSDPMQLEIHAKVTAGTGSVSVAVLRSFGYFV